MRRKAMAFRVAVICLGLATSIGVPAANGQTKTYERTYGQPEAAVKKALQQMQGGMAGHLPLLDGFAVADEHPLERYQRGYFQATVQVRPNSNGGSVVRVSAKVTAWYDDPQKAHSGYELLHSNGRIEADTRPASEQLTSAKPNSEQQPVEILHPEPNAPGTAADTLQTKSEKPKVETGQSDAHNSASESTISAPQPHMFDAPSNLSSPLSQGLASSANGSQPSKPESTPKADPERTRLQAEIEQLQEVLKNQAHPKNMVAVKNLARPWWPHPA